MKVGSIFILDKTNERS